MRIKIQCRDGAFKVESTGDIKDLSILSSIGYREAIDWATTYENTEIVLRGLTARGASDVKEYVEASLLDQYCRAVWGQGVPDNPDFCFGFYVGLGEAVKRLSGQNND